LCKTDKYYVGKTTDIVEVDEWTCRRV